MTMFAKGTWTVLSLVSEEEAFKTKLEADGWDFMPFKAQAQALNTHDHSIGLAPFDQPRLGDVEEIVAIKAGKADVLDPQALRLIFTDKPWVYNAEDDTLEDPGVGTIDLQDNKLWDNNPENWKIAEGVYAFWMIGFDWEDVHDMNSKKESLAYSYGSPFKYQPSDIKAQITADVEELDTITRKQFQVVVDFNLKRVWINSPSKNVVGDLLLTLGSLDVATEAWRPEEEYLMGPQWTETFLRKLVDASEFHDDFNARAAEIRMHGVNGVEPNEQSYMEKILKNYFAFTENGGGEDYLAFGGPLSVRLAPTVASTVTLKTPYEATEMLNDDNHTLLLSGAPMTFCRLFEKVSGSNSRMILIKDFSIEVTSNTLAPDNPGFIVKGINLDNFKKTLKEFIKATGSITVKDYWNLWYYGMNSSLFRYFNLVKETMES